MTTANRSVARFKVGDWVSFRYGVRSVWAQIIEDRGSLGVNRRRLYRIRLGDGPEEAVMFEVPEEYMTPAVPGRSETIEYLKGGGLVAILRSNLGGGRNPPRAWLTFGPSGNLIHTFDEERGLLGGGEVPFFALQGQQIFAPKSDEVVAFLSCFDLPREEAEDVIRSVGIFP